MQPLFSDTSQEWKTLEQQNNSLVFSSLNEFYQPVKSKGFAIKYVVEGFETYTLNEYQYHVGTNQYLLCNSSKEGHVNIEAGKNAKGICINLVPALIEEAVASMRRPDTGYPDVELGTFFSTPYFLDHLYKADETITGKALLQLGKDVSQNQFEYSRLNMEFFYSLAEKVVADQLPVFKQLQSLPVIKSGTRKELYKRISKGREFIDHAYANPLTISLIAKEACMSEYHFFRLFKKMMGLSPHQYLQHKRLEHGKRILEQQQLSVSETALETGFPDIYSFSKAFKNLYGFAPSALIRK